MTTTRSVATLSVIIPVYNVLNYVQEAVDSVINQSVPPAEVILVDAGSDDGSGELIESLYGHHAFVSIIHVGNVGAGEARNIGTRVATGDFIYYFDADDILINGLLARFQTVLRAHPDMDIFAFSAESFEDPLMTQQDTHRPAVRLMSYRQQITSVFSGGEQAFNALSRMGNFIPTVWLYIWSNRLQRQHQLAFLPVIHEDEAFTPRLFFVAGKTCVIDQIYFRRRLRRGSVMQSSRTEKNVIGYLRACDALEAIVAQVSERASIKHLQARIVTNIINVIGIRQRSGICLTDATRSEFDRLCENYRNYDIRLAERNFFIWRMINYALKQLKLRT